MDEQTAYGFGTTGLSSVERRVRHLLGSAPLDRGPVARVDWVHDAARHPALARIGITADG